MHIVAAFSIRYHVIINNDNKYRLLKLIILHEKVSGITVNAVFFKPGILAPYNFVYVFFIIVHSYLFHDILLYRQAKAHFGKI